MDFVECGLDLCFRMFWFFLICCVGLVLRLWSCCSCMGLFGGGWFEVYVFVSFWSGCGCLICFVVCGSICMSFLVVCVSGC